VKQYDEDKAFLKDYYSLVDKIRDIEFARDATKKAIIGKNGRKYDKALVEYKRALSSDRYVAAMKAKIHLKNTMDKINKILGRLDEEKDQAAVSELKAERTRLMKKAKGYLEEMEN
jgi:restriction endonuclease S subunit